MDDAPVTAPRRRIMSSIGGKNTRPELIVRQFLHGSGFRFRLHRRDLPGTPDIVLPRHRVVIFVHGCFWHRHEGCRYFSVPKTRTEFWMAKLDRNVANDSRHRTELEQAGWRIIVVWECGLLKDQRGHTLSCLLGEIDPDVSLDFANEHWA